MKLLEKVFIKAKKFDRLSRVYKNLSPTQREQERALFENAFSEFDEAVDAFLDEKLAAKKKGKKASDPVKTADPIKNEKPVKNAEPDHDIFS